MESRTNILAISAAAKSIKIQPASLDIWDKKYRLKDCQGNAVDSDMDATYRRVARTLSEVEEPGKREYWSDRFL
ncbi:MAG: ribonucleoside-diphosphate reductase, adenosylcobalamin-dependent, partial [Pseudomonadota bacterium]